MNIPIWLILKIVCLSMVSSKTLEGKNEVALNSIHDDPRKDNLIYTLSSEPKCTKDFKRICGQDYKSFDNIDILNCVQTAKRVESSELSEECHHVLWTYKTNITQENHVGEIIKRYCNDNEKVTAQCSSSDGSNGAFISCMVQNVNELKGKCYDAVVQIGIVVFSDFHLLHSLVANCKTDIEKLQCGRIEADSAYHHSQGSTIECLESHVEELNKNCKSKILSVSEIQSEDVRFDRPFYFACSEERRSFCPHVKYDSGVFICLLRFQHEDDMSEECSSQVNRRVQLMMVDYKTDGVFSKECGKAIEDYNCPVKSLPEVITCLNRALKDHKKVKTKCRSLVSMYRSILVSQSSVFLQTCKKELLEFCDDVKEQKKIHCLIRHVMNGPEISFGCRRSLEDLMKTSNPAEDWNVDPALHSACLPVYQAECKGLRGGQGKVMHCLMNNVQSPHMTDDCKRMILEIDYFVSRDWQLDPQLFLNCRSDAARVCSAGNDWSNAETALVGPSNDILVLPCLFRTAFSPTHDLRLSKACEKSVRRAMEARVVLVELPPQIERECREPLSTMCSSDTSKGAELMCLKNNYLNLDGSCKEWVKTQIKAESIDVKLNYPLMTYCGPIISQVCGGAASNEENEVDDAVFRCLMRKKHSPIIQEKPKCVAAIEKFQLVYILDIDFSSGFLKSCMPDLRKFCSRLMPNGKRREKIDCLSERLLNGVLTEEQTLSTSCSQQLTEQLKVRHESVKLDPTLREACSDDISNLCGSSKRGHAYVLNCLRKSTPKLSTKCQEVVSRREQVESINPNTDFLLMRACDSMINSYCNGVKPKEILHCLMRNKGTDDFDLNCREVVMRRMEERVKDVRLNPLLFSECKKDINFYCRREWLAIGSSRNKGLVLECLKNQLPLKSLRPKCEEKVIHIMKLGSMYSRLNPVLQRKCSDDIKVLCNPTEANQGKGEIEECLKLQLEQNLISSPECQEYVSILMQRERADIHTDVVLYRACQVDDEMFCNQKKRGDHFACLLDVLNRNSNALSPDCKQKLRERREMLKSALKFGKVESVGELIDGVRASPERNFLITLLIFAIGIIFTLGLVFGRASKRKYALLKNR